MKDFLGFMLCHLAGFTGRAWLLTMNACCLFWGIGVPKRYEWFGIYNNLKFDLIDHSALILWLSFKAPRESKFEVSRDLFSLLKSQNFDVKIQLTVN